MAQKSGRGRRSESRRAVAALLRQFPRFLRLCYRLLRDPRIPRVDKMLVLGAIGYALMPADLVPDFLGFFGLVDDLYLLGLVLDRMLIHAGPELLHEHWDGTPGALRFLLDGLDQVGSFVPAPVRALLRGRARR